MDRIIYSVIISFVLTLASGVIVIPLLSKLKLGQNIRDDGPKSHYAKAGTPTMGGIIFIIPIVLVSLALSTGSYDYVLAAIISTLGFGAIGFLDDYIMVYMKRSLALRRIKSSLDRLPYRYYLQPLHIGPEVATSTSPFQGRNGIWDILYSV